MAAVTVCPICSNRMETCFTAQVLSKYPARYENCSACGFLRTPDPHWLGEAYSQPIAAADTGLVMRNIAIAGKLAGVLYWLMHDRGKGRYLDVAGGYGMLTRLMRDLGFDFYWQDKYCDNLLAPGFVYNQAIGSCTAVTAIEVMEHLTDPLAFIKETLAFSGARALLFTTELYEGSPPEPDAWWYYSFATGQHIGFFQRRTLAALAAKLNLRLASAGGIHILSETAVNESLLRVVTDRVVSRAASWWIRYRLGSKTISDHEAMLRKTADS